MGKFLVMKLNDKPQLTATDSTANFLHLNI